MKVKRLNIEKLVICMLIFINTYFGILILNTEKYYGDFLNQPLRLNKNIVILYIFMYILLFLISYFYYRKIEIKLPLKNFLFCLNKKRLNIFFTIITIIQIIFYFETGIGKAGTISRNSFSFIFNLFNLDCFFLFYYIIAREKNFLYVLNILLYISYYLIRGWTGVFYFIFIIEGSFFFDKKKLSNLYIILIIPILILGGKIYQYLYFLKNYIRYNVSLKIDFLSGLNHLLGRLSVISNSLIGFQNADIIKKLYLEQNLQYVEIRSFFSPLLPGALFNKNFDILNNLIITSEYGKIPNISFVMGLISFIYNLYNIKVRELILWIIFFMIIFSLYIKLVMFFIKISGKKELKILIFIYILDLCNNGSLVFNNPGWFKIYFFIFIFFLLKIIRIKKNS